MRITLVHSGRAYLPEIEAYRRHFSDRFEFRVIEKSALSGTDLSADIAWLVMGFFPGRVRAAAVVHDYRSLSVGRFCRAKDVLKRRLTPRPNLRIIQNEDVEAAMAFGDDVPRTTLGMGVHAHLVTEERLAREPEFDFCAVGDVSRARGADRWLRSFVTAWPGRSLALAGHAERAIREEFEAVPEITFLGPVALEEAYDLISRSRTGISWVPDRYPYSIQAVTKMLEYAAFGRAVVANDSRANRATAERHGIEVCFATGAGFPGEREIAATPDNSGFEVDRISWERRFEESGIDQLLASLLS